MDKVVLPTNIYTQKCQLLNNIAIPISEDLTIDIDFFRSLYISDRVSFFSIVNELALRGTNFNNSSPIFPNYTSIDNNSLVISTINANNDSAFLNVNFSFFGIKQTLKLFNIDSNAFFEGIPLDGFLSLGLQFHKLNLLKQEFEKNGFNFILMKEHLIEQKNHTDLDKIPENISPQIDFVQSQIVLKNKSLQTVISDNVNEITGLIDITKIVANQDLLKLFKKNNIVNLSDMNTEVGIKTLNKFNSKLSKILISNISRIYSNDSALSDGLYKYLSQLEYISNHPIESILDSSRYSSIISQTKAKHIHFLSDLSTYDVILSFFDSYGFGVQKKKDVMHNIKKLVQNIGAITLNNNKTNEEFLSKNIFIYPLLKKLTDDTYIHSKKLYFTTIEQGIKIIANHTTETENIIQEKLIQNYKQSTLLESKNTEIPIEFDVTLYSAINFFELNFLLDFDNFKDFSKRKLSELIINSEYLDENLKLVINHILSLINTFMTPYNDVLNFINSSKTRDVEIFKLRLSGMTLHEIGDLFNISRERVRQIEKKFYKKINRIMPPNILRIFELSFYEDGFYHVNTSFTFDKLLLNLIDNNLDSELEFSKEWNMIVNKKNIRTLNKIDSLFKSISTTGYIEEIDLRKKILLLKNKHNKTFINKLYGNFTSMLKRYNLELKEGYIFNSKISYINFFELIIIAKMNGHIDLKNESDLNNFKFAFSQFKNTNEANEYFSDENEKIVRKIASIVSRNNTFISLGSNEFRTVNRHKIPYQLIYEIGAFIEQILIEEEFVSPLKIMNAYQKQLDSLGYNFDVIYNFLKRSFENKFDFGKGNTMYIFPKGAEKLSTETLIYNKLKQLGGYVHKNILENELGLTRTTIDQNIAKSRFMRSINGYLKLIEDQSNIVENKNFTDHVLLAGFKQLDLQNFISINMLFQELRFNEDFSTILNTYRINNDVELSPIIKQLFPDLIGHTKYLYPASSKLETYQVFLSQISDTYSFTKKDFLEAGDVLNYGHSTRELTLDSAINDLKIVRLNSSGYFMDGSLLIVDDDIISSLRRYIESQFDEGSFLSLQTLKGYKRQLNPLPSSISWSHELIHYISLKYLNYSPVNIPGIHYYEDPLIITPANSELTYSEIVLEKLSDYDGNMHEHYLYDYFKSEGLVNGSSKSKKLPKLLFDEELISKNDFDIITVNEVV